MSHIWRILQELRKRRVFRVAGIYAVVGWTVLQVADVALVPIGMPSWAMTVLVWLVIVGFMIAIVLGWRYQLTPNGVIRSHNIAGDDTDVNLHTIDYVIFASLAIAVCIVALGMVNRVAEPPPVEIPMDYPVGSIAILPFQDLSPESDQQHLAEGLADTLISRLGKYPHLRVTARTSSFAFKDRDIDVREIARSLNSSAIVEGSLFKSDDQIRVTVRLVDGRTGRQAMSQEFSRPVNDFILLQDDIAGTVANYAGLNPPAQLVNYATSAPANFESYELYVLGRHQWHRRTADSLRAAINYFQQAIRQDPGYALAWSGLADSYTLLVQYSNISIDDIYEDSKAAVDQAVLLNPDLAEAHASKGLLELFSGDNLAAANSLRQAIELNPNYSMAYVWLGRSFWFQNRYADALVRYSKALDLDPQSPIVNLNVALSHRQLGQNESARSIFEKILSIDPTFHSAYWGIAGIHWNEGESDMAVFRLLQGIDHGLEQWPALLTLAGAYIDLGRFEEANYWLNKAEVLSGGDYLTIEAKLFFYQTTGQFDAYNELALKNLRADSGNEFVIERMAFAKTLVGQFDDAAAYYQRAEDLSPDNLWQTNQFWFMWGRMPSVDWANALLQIGDKQKAYELMDGILQRWKVNESLGVFEVPEYRYMEACIHAIRGNRDQSLAALRIAFDHGWRRYRWAKLDPKLNLLHNDVGFIDLIQDVENEVNVQNGNLDKLLAPRAPSNDSV